MVFWQMLNSLEYSLNMEFEDIDYPVTIRRERLSAFPNYALKAWETGAKGFMVKPLDVQDVIRQLERLKISLPAQNSQGKAERPEAGR